MQDIELFPCYSVPLMEFLTKEKKLRYKLIGLHPKTYNTFWVFIRDDELNSYLEEWKR